MLVHCWGALDGVKIGIQKPSDDVRQSHFYNGWTHDHYISNLFLFSPEGQICAAYLNSPVTTYNSTMATMSKVYCEINSIYNRMDGMDKVVVDSTFASEEWDSLIKSYQTNQARNGSLRQDERVNNEATAMKQMAEWGIHAFQGLFPRLNEKTLFKERGERKIMLNLMALLYNFRVSNVGQNQISNV